MPRPRKTFASTRISSVSDHRSSKACLDFKEKSNNEHASNVDLDDASPGIFGEGVSWMFSKAPKKPRGSKQELRGEEWGEGGQEVAKLADVYCMANKFTMEELQNDVMNEVMDWHKNNICHLAALVKLSEREIGDCRLRDYLLHEIASDMHFKLGVFAERHGGRCDLVCLLQSRVRRRHLQNHSASAGTLWARV